MIAYIHHGYVVAYDQCGECCYSGPVADVPECEHIVRGSGARDMIAEYRHPRLRRVIRDEPGIKITVPV